MQDYTPNSDIRIEALLIQANGVPLTSIATNYKVRLTVTNPSATIIADNVSLTAAANHAGDGVWFSSILAANTTPIGTYKCTWSYKDETALTGTISTTSGSTAIIGVGTLFTTELVVGSIISFTTSGTTYFRTVTAITDATHLTMGSGAATTVGGLSATKADIIIERRTSFNVNYQYLTRTLLYNIRHSLARAVEGKDGFWIGTATAGAAASLTDTNRKEPDDYFNGSSIYIYQGTSIGDERTITDFVQATGVITAGSIFTATPTISSKYEIHKYLNVGDYNDAIRLAIRSLSGFVLEPIVDTSITLASNTYEYSIPSQFSHIFKVQVKIVDDQYRDLVAAGWDIMRGNRKIRFLPEIIWNYTGQVIRILGFRPPLDPLEDMSPITVSEEYVLKKAGAILCSQLISGRENDSRGYTSKYQLFNADAMTERQNINRSIPANCRKVE